MKWWLVLGIGAVVMLSAAYGLWNSGAPVQAAAARRGAIREFVDESGKTRLPKTHLLTMPFPGRLEEIELHEGQPVSQGQVVAKLVSSDLENEVAEAVASVERLEASIAENEDSLIEQTSKQQALAFVESMRHTVAAAEERKTSGKARLDYAEKFLADVVRLAKSGARTRDEVDQAEVSYTERRVDYRQDVLVAEAIKAIQAATILLPTLIDNYIQHKSFSRAVLVKQQAESDARLKQARVRQERGAMRSPVDGIVLERRVHNEQFVGGGEVLVRIGRLEELEVECDVLSQDVVRVQVGQPAEIYGPAVGADVGAGLPGRVARIYPAGFTKVSSLGVEQQRVKVIVEFADGLRPRLAQLRTGVDYRVRVRIFTAHRDDALIVPRTALFRGADGGWQTFAVRRGRARLQPVTLGLLNDEQAEVTEGLNAEDLVVLAPENSLRHGDRVQAIAVR